ncbi:MAG: phosphoenolpyruvate--protein phosphotransferase, partial [Lachnospiraceae bacterium]|nr:phosphoenolpyruvate--protein phosphotransferase [Lachnospiraceae bacterium]
MAEGLSGKKFSGKTVYNGITMGKVMVLRKDQEQIRRTKVENAEHEIDRVQSAVDVSKQQLAALYDKAVKEVGESSAAIFEVHQMMLEDEDYLDAIYHVIRTELVNAEYAVAITGDNFAGMFAGMDDEFMQARAADVK